MNEKKTLDLFAVASVPLVMTLGNSMLIPVLPLMEKELGISPFQSSLIITVYSLVAIVLIPIAGYLSDRWGRKKIIVPSLLITAIGGLISGLAAMFMSGAFVWILIGRIIQGIGASGTFPVVLPLIGDMYKDDEKVSSGLGMVETSNTVGKVLSPIVGASLAMIAWYVPLLSIPVFSVLSLLAVVFLLKVPKNDEEKPVLFKEFLQGIQCIFIQKGRWLYGIFAIGCIQMYILFGVLFHLSTLLEESHGQTGIMKGLILAIPLLALSMTSYITGKNIGNDKIRMKWITFVGCIGLTTSIFLISFSEHIIWIISGLVLSGVGIGLSLPCLDTFITAGIDKQRRGTISSIYSSARFIGVALGPPVFAILITYSHQFLFLSTASIGFIASLLALLIIRPKSNVSSQ